MKKKFQEMLDIAEQDVEELMEAEKSYGNSWRKRGGVGAFMMLARKWDRIENQVQGSNFDIFSAIQNDTRPEGIIDDIHDLRRYLILVEQHVSSNKEESE
tara:strand:+ start:8773 stop:9072 length:300 start_codon:yes stop_codon:yes gene_type:complete